LAAGGIDASGLDAVVFSDFRFDAKAVLVHKYSAFTVQDRIREQRDFWLPRFSRGTSPRFLEVFKDRVDTEQFGGDWNLLIRRLQEEGAEVEDALGQEFRRQAVCNHLGVAPSKVSFVNHHRAHGYHAYYGSPIEKRKVVILTADAWGGDCNATVSLAEEGRITSLSVSTDFLAARLYRSITLLLGMKPDEHEYKLMGLAPYAKPDYVRGPLKVFRETQFVDGLKFGFHEKPSDLYFYFKEKLEGYRFDAIAGALQAYTEDILQQWAANALKETCARHLVFGGGAGMNVKAMMEIAQLPEVEDLFVCPSPSDESLAIGAAYVFMHDHLTEAGHDPRTVLKPLRNAYLGPSLSSEEVRLAIEPFSTNRAYEVVEESDPTVAAKLLSEGKVLARCVGRSEFGARSLGNRSILADPRRSTVVRVINDKIKSRDFWMPFAPTILASRADDYLANRKGMRAPYMTLGFHTTRLAQDELQAALHPADGTCRPQVLEPEQNPSYHELVGAFERLTGVGGVLNTSFNLHGEPIVQSAADAARVFTASGLDGLILDRFLITKVTSSQ
jgi:carbamoyltransferase